MFTECDVLGFVNMNNDLGIRVTYENVVQEVRIKQNKIYIYIHYIYI